MYGSRRQRVLGDTWPTCSLSRGQRCLHDQVDLDTLTALLAAIHQTVEPTASCSGCGRRSPRLDGAALADSENRHGRAQVSLLVDPLAARCLTGLTDHRDRRQGSGVGGAAMPGRSSGAPAAALSSELRTSRGAPATLQLDGLLGTTRPPHNCAGYGPQRPGETLDRMAVGQGYMVRMMSAVRFRRGAPPTR
jgi:hypothetical protein